MTQTNASYIQNISTSSRHFRSQINIAGKYMTALKSIEKARQKYTSHKCYNKHFVQNQTEPKTKIDTYIFELWIGETNCWCTARQIFDNKVPCGYYTVLYGMVPDYVCQYIQL